MLADFTESRDKPAPGGYTHLHWEPMHEGNDDSKVERRARELLNAAADAERRLLRQERKAEKRLAEARAVLRDAEARLLRAQERVAEYRQAVLAAEAELRESQRRRAIGPQASDG